MKVSSNFPKFFAKQGKHSVSVYEVDIFSKFLLNQFFKTLEMLSGMKKKREKKIKLTKNCNVTRNPNEIFQHHLHKDYLFQVQLSFNFFLQS